MSIIDRLLDEAEKAQRKGHLLLAEVCRDAADELGLVIEERNRLRGIVRDLLSVMPVLPAAAKHIVGMEDRYNSAITNARTALKEIGHE
jgi:hypothetical protein